METALTWMQALEAQNKGLFARLWAMARLPARVRSSAMTLPMQLADVSAVGHPVDYFRDWVAHREPGDPWWLPMHFATDLSVVPPLVLVAGWQDMFLPDQLADYAALRAAGRQVRLIIGDWTHHSPGAGLTTVAESFRLPAHPGEPLTGAAVRYEIAGGGGWRECESWPPVTSSALWYLAVDEPPQAAPGTTTEQLRTAVSEAAVDELSQATSGTATEQLRTAISEAAVDELSQATSGTATLSHRVVRNRRTQRGASLGSGLLQSVPGATAEVSYRYDPANPTPQAGGRSLNPFECGRRSQRAREARQDVVLFTSEPLATTLDIVGTATFVAEFSSSNPRVDLMVRLCDVDERGVSHTVTDGYVRMIAADIARCADTLERSVEVSDNITKCGDTLKRNVELADVCQLGSDIPVEDTSTRRRSFVLQLDPTAYRFAAGHCLRLQVSSGAHPLHLRNLGSDDPVTAQHPTASEQQLFLGLTGCRLELPVLG
jgi:predicted acyl esterase